MIFELSKMSRLDVPENSVKNNIAIGTVLQLNGYDNPKYCIVKNLGPTGRFPEYGSRYQVISLSNFAQTMYNAYELKYLSEKQDNRIAVYITNEVLSSEEIMDLFNKRDQMIVKVAKEKEMKETRDKEVKEALIKQYGRTLEAQAGSKKSSYALGASNIKRELKAAFPSTKFSVRSQSYSGGCSIDVDWVDGVITDQVEAIISKYQEGSFDGMTDCYNYDSDNFFPDLFGGAKYVMRQRSISPEVMDQCAKDLCKIFGKEFISQEQPFSDSWLGNQAYRYLCKINLVDGYNIDKLNKAIGG